MERLAGVIPTTENESETAQEEEALEEKEEIVEPQKPLPTEQPIRGSDSMLEIEDTPAPWTRKDRSNQSQSEKLLENANWIFRKSKGAYWVVAGVAGVGTLTSLMGVWGK